MKKIILNLLVICKIKNLWTNKKKVNKVRVSCLLTFVLILSTSLLHFKLRHKIFPFLGNQISAPSNPKASDDVDEGEHSILFSYFLSLFLLAIILVFLFFCFDLSGPFFYCRRCSWLYIYK